MKQFSEKEMKKALRNELEISDTVEQRMQETYEMLGAGEHRKVYRPMRGRRWTVVFAATMLAVSTSVIALAANGFFTKEFQQNGKKSAYKFEVNYELTPYDMEAELKYLPEGFALKDSTSPYGGKIKNDETGANIGCYVYNAAQLDEMEELKFANVTSVDKTEIQDMEAHIVTMQGEVSTREILLFNEQEGYVAAIYCIEEEPNVPLSELKKTAEHMEITKLETQTAYLSQKEKEQREKGRKQAEAQMAREFAGGVSKENICEPGEELSDRYAKENIENGFGTEEQWGDIRFTVQDVEIRDSLPLTEFGPENYADYENEVKMWVNADGTLKPRERKRYKIDEYGITAEEAYMTEQGVKSKYVLVKMKAENMLNTGKDNVYVAPMMKYLTEEADGHYSYPKERFDTKNYGLQSELPVAFDKFEGADSREDKKEFLMRNMGAGEELEYTLVYIVDEDRLSDMYLCFFTEHSESDYWKYVKLSK